MKQVLSLLMAFIFLQVQTWALSGGPIYVSTASTNQAGVYAGVMLQNKLIYGPNVAVPSDNLGNAGNIGVFSVTVPLTGTTSGTVAVFISGITFTGSITGVADPDLLTFDGVIQATATFAVPAGTAVAQGSMSVDIVESVTPQAGRTDTSAGIAARLTGTAILDAFVSASNNFTPNTLVQSQYSVSGYRQLTTPLP